MISLPLIITILVIAVIVFGIEKRWWAGKKEEASAKPTPETQTAYTSKITDRFKSLRNRVMPDRQPGLPKQFQVWAVEVLAEQKTLKDWLTAFSAEEARSFTEQLAAFCDDLNLDLAWLVQQQLAKDPEVEQVAKLVVIDYCQACYQAAQAQLDFKAFGTFQAMIQTPKGYRVLSQKLFTQLVNQKLAAPISPDLFLAAEDKRQAHMLDTIRQAAEKDRKKFMAILKQVLAAEASANGAKHEAWIAKITQPFKKFEPAEEAKPAPTVTT